MSWDYIIEVDHANSDSIEQLKHGLVRIANAMFLSPLFDEIFRLRVYEGSSYKVVKTKKGSDYQENITEEIARPTPSEHPIPIETVRTFITQHASEHSRLEIRSGVIQVVRESIPVQHENGTTSLSPYNATGPMYKSGSSFWITLEGKDFRDGPPSSPPVGRTNLYFDVGNARYYNVCRHGESARLSMGFLLQDLSAILDENIIGMRGLNADQSQKPGDFSLRYVRYPHVLLHDLIGQGLIQNPDLVLYEEHILLAADSARDIRVHTTPSGFIIYHDNGTGGRLESFYEELAKTLV